MSRTFTIKIDPEYSFALGMLLHMMSKGMFPKYDDINQWLDIIDAIREKKYNQYAILDAISKCHKDSMEILSDCLEFPNNDTRVFKFKATQTNINKLKATQKWLNKTDLYSPFFFFSYPVRVATRLLEVLLRKFIECADRGDDTIDLENIMEQIDDDEIDF